MKYVCLIVFWFSWLINSSFAQVLPYSPFLSPTSFSISSRTDGPYSPSFGNIGPGSSLSITYIIVNKNGDTTIMQMKVNTDIVKVLKEIDSLYRNKEFGKAVLKAEEAEKQYAQTRINLMMTRAFCYWKIHKYDSAITCYNQILELDSTNLVAWICKGNILEQYNRQIEAMNCYAKVLSINPRYSDAFYYMGMLLAGQGKNNEAVRCFRKAIAIDTNKLHITLYKAFIFHSQHNNHKAIEYYDKATSIDTLSTLAWYNKGVTYENVENELEAEKCFKKVIRINPDDAQSWNRLGYIYIRQNNPKEAMNCFDCSILIDSINSYAWYGKGDILSTQGNTEASEKCYQKATDFDPNIGNKVDNCIRFGKITDAEKYIDKAIAIDSTNSNALNLKGAILFLKNPFDNNAVKYLEKALKFDSLNIGGWHNMTALLLKRNISDSALTNKNFPKYINKMLDIDSSYALAWYLMGGYHFWQGLKHKEAFDCVNKAISLEPHYRDAFVSKASMFLEMSNLDSALESCNSAIAIDPIYSISWDLKGWIFDRRGNLDSAMKCYTKAILLDSLCVNAIVARGTLYYNKGNYIEAIKSYNKAIKIDSTNYYTWNQLGSSYNSQKRFNDALYCFEKSISINSSQTYAWYEKAYAFLLLNKPNKALRYCNKAIEIDPTEVNAWYYKGCIYNKKRKPNMAKNCFNKAILYFNKVVQGKQLDYNDWYFKGNCYFLMNMFNEAVYCYDTVIKISPKHSYAWFHRGQIYEYLGDAEESDWCHYNSSNVQIDDLQDFYSPEFKIVKNLQTNQNISTPDLKDFEMTRTNPINGQLYLSDLRVKPSESKKSIVTEDIYTGPVKGFSTERDTIKYCERLDLGEFSITNSILIPVRVILYVEDKDPTGNSMGVASWWEDITINPNETIRLIDIKVAKYGYFIIEITKEKSIRRDSGDINIKKCISSHLIIK
jgi:tetratricopeptide (TPR) repeat protein